MRPFTMLHPDVPAEMRGTVAALAHPAVLGQLIRLGVSAVELMPITAWIDERHLGPLGLTNGWGYNPVAMLVPDPRLCPGGIEELRATTAALRAAGIGVILDVVFNHTGESDVHGPTLSLRGLDARAYFRHDGHGRLINDTGTGNTLDCDHPATRRLVLDALRHFVGQAGVDGFRFDLAPILGRTAHGFDPKAALLTEMLADPLLGDRVLIAEPWDIGPGGYQLGNFPPPFLEWNDRYRDRVRRFWRGDRHMLGDFATAFAGSSRRVPAARHAQRELHRRARRLHARGPGRLRAQAQPRQRRAQPRRPRREPVLEQRPRGPVRRSGRAGGARARPARAARDVVRDPGHDPVDRRRRVRPQPARQQQRLRPGQSDHLARLGEPRHCAGGLVRAAVGTAAGDARARRPATPDRAPRDRTACRTSPG